MSPTLFAFNAKRELNSLKTLLSIILISGLLCCCQLSVDELLSSEALSREYATREWTSFNDFLTTIYQTPNDERQALVDSFLIWAEAQTGIPYIEDTTAFFLYTSAGNPSVQLAGDFNAWSPGNSSLSPVGYTNLYYRAETFELDARLDYKFVLNGSSWILDPRNPNTCAGGYGPNSELAMPWYEQPDEILEHDIPHGTIESFTFNDETQGRSRTVWVYLPPGYEVSADSFRTAYFHDGADYINLAFPNNVLDYLIHNQEIPPIIAVFVDPTNRMTEYAYDDNFLSMFVNELVPHIDTNYRTLTDAHDRAILGPSLAGMSALYFTLMEPDVFANAAAYSPAIWGQYGAVVGMYADSAILDVKIYVDGGTYEGSFESAMLPFAMSLQDAGWESIWNVWHEGHSWGAWRAHLDESLKYFWPLVATGIDERDY